MLWVINQAPWLDLLIKLPGTNTEAARLVSRWLSTLVLPTLPNEFRFVTAAVSRASFPEASIKTSALAWLATTEQTTTAEIHEFKNFILFNSIALQY
jgi:hypothetical protein